MMATLERAGNRQLFHMQQTNTPWGDTTDATSTASIYTNWCDTSTSATNAITWSAWSGGSATCTIDVSFHLPTEPPERVRTRLREAEEFRHQQEREYIVRKKREDEAVGKALKLLNSCLSDEEKRLYHEKRYIDVWSKSGRCFRIKHGRQQNIYELDRQGREVREFCVHVSPRVPHEDNLLAQKLMIEYEEERFLKTANIRELRPAA